MCVGPYHAERNSTRSREMSQELAKSYQCLAFVRRNLNYCPEKRRRLSYIYLIRYKLEYSSSVWDPHLRKDIHQLEMVQPRVARFVKRDYSCDSSVSQMLKYIDLYTLENRRKMYKLTLLYTICGGSSALYSMIIILCGSICFSLFRITMILEHFSVTLSECFFFQFRFQSNFNPRN